MDIRINNTNTKYEVWVNIYLADFFFEIFKFFNQKEPHLAQQVKLEMKAYDIKKKRIVYCGLEVLLFCIMPYEKEVIKKHK